MADSSLRLVLLLREIPREPQFISSQNLLEQLIDAGHEVSLRTVQRDLQALSAYFPLIQNKPHGRGKTGLGWAFAANSQSISFPLMGSAAALTLMLAQQHLQSLLPAEVLNHLEPYIQEAQNLLDTQNKGQYRDWFNKVRIAPSNILLPPQIDADTLTLIYQALLENRQFSATYNNQPERIIHPYGLVQQGSVLYLICRFYDYDDVRITALHRYAEVAVLDKAAREFVSFNIDDYLQLGVMHWSPGEQIQLELRMKSWLGKHLDESPLCYQQQLLQQDDGSFNLTAKIIDSVQLRRWLLSYSTELEVIEPMELREWLGQELAKAADKYAK